MSWTLDARPSFLVRCLRFSVVMMAVQACSIDDGASLKSFEEKRAENSYIGQHVQDVLSASSAMRERTWNVSSDNIFAPSWLMPTPVNFSWGMSTSSLAVAPSCKQECDPDFGLKLCESQDDCSEGGICQAVHASVKSPGESPRKMCVGHSDSFVDELYGLIVSGQRYVDIASLQPPDGRFLAAFRNAMTMLAHKPSPPTVRLLFGSIPGPKINIQRFLKQLTRDVPVNSDISISAGMMRSSNVPLTWNHAKLIAIDGKQALVGGHNLWTQHYLDKNPTHDLSMRVQGSAAGDAHRFANVLWKYTCETASILTRVTGSVTFYQRGLNGISTACPQSYGLVVPAGPASGTVISVGRLGYGIANDGNQADAALVAMIDAAKSSIRMSLQDIGPPRFPILSIPVSAWPAAVLDALGKALLRDVDVYIVLSNPNARAGGLGMSATYWNGWSLSEVIQQLRDHIARLPNAPQREELRDLICRKLYVAPFRYSESPNWADGSSLANHAKSFIVDDQALYIGSQNLYPADLQEFGYIVDDSRAAASFLTSYWQPLWSYSKPFAVSGADVSTCVLH